MRPCSAQEIGELLKCAVGTGDGPCVSLPYRRVSSPPAKVRAPWLVAYALATGSCFALTFASVCPAHAAEPPTLPSSEPASDDSMAIANDELEPELEPESEPEPERNARTSAAVGNRAHSVEALSRRLEAWVSDPDPAANAKAVHRVAQGVPPGAMVAFLVAVTEHPRPAFESTVKTATRYRKLAVRGHALAAWAAFGPQQAAEAIALAVDDREQGVRRLAVALQQAHASPTSEALVARMLERDATLAAEASAPVNLVPDEPPPPEAKSSSEADETIEIIVVDDVPVEDEIIVIDDEAPDGDAS